MKMSYGRFGLVLMVSLALMFVLSMSMVRTVDHFYLNPSNFYMALVMVAAMGLVMLGAMWKMFPSPRANVALAVGFVVVFAGALALGRTEALVGDEGFLTSMIPHHSRAILTCQESAISDPEIVELCRKIVDAQQQEITQMKSILERY